MPRLNVELLETRTLPAVTSSLAGGTLSVLLDAANDFATIAVVGNEIRVINGVSPKSYSLAAVQRISVEGNDLKDQRLVLRDTLALPDTLVADQLSAILVRGDYSAAGIDLTASGTLTLNPGASLSTRRVAAGADPLTTASTGDSGDLRLEAPAITLADGAALLAHADSGFASGDVALTAVNAIDLDYVLGLPLFQTLNGKATITVGDADIRGGAITLTATAESVKTADQDDPAPGPVSEILLEVLDEQPLANSFRAVLAEPTATITVGAGADLRSDGGLTARATARSEVELVADTDGGVIVYGSSSPTSSVTFESGSTVQAGGAFDARALVENDLDVTALVPSGGTNVASTAYGKARSVATAAVKDGATVTAGSALVRADADNTFRTRAIADGFDIPDSAGAGVGAALAVGDYSSVVTTSVLGTLTVTGDASVEASSTTESQVRSFASVAEPVIPGVLGTSVEDLLADYDLSEVTDDTPVGSDSAAVQVGAAVTLAFTENRAVAELGGTASAENVTVSAEAKDDLRTSATSSAGAAALGAVGGALIVSDASNTATATVSPAAVIDASETLTVSATATVAGESPELDLADVIDGAENAGEAIRDGLDPVGAFLTGVLAEQFETATTFVHTGGHVEKSGAAGVSGGANFYTLDNAATASVGAGASINQNSTGADEQSVSVTATAAVDASHLAGQVSALNFRSQDGQAVLTAGGFAETVDQSNTANAFIDDGVALSATTDVTVDADTITNVLAVVASGSTEGGNIGVRGAGTSLELTGAAAAWVEESASVEAGGAVNVTANNAAKVINAAAVVADVGLVALAGSAATNRIELTTRALIADVNGIAGGPGAVTAGEVLVRAENTGAHLALSGGAALPVSGSGAQAAIGVAEASNVAANTVLAEISGTTVTALSDVAVGASSDPRLVALAAGGVGAEAFALTNPGAYNQSAGTTEAFVRDAVVTAEGDLTVTAADTTNAQALAGGGAGATIVSFGTASALNDIADTLRAGVEGSTIDATRIGAGAGSDAKFLAISGAGAGADTGAGSFSESTNEIADTIDAHISGSVLTATGAVGVAALGAPTVLALAGAGAGGGTAAGAWAIADNVIGGSVNATLENTDVAAQGLGVAARGGGEIDAIAVGGSGAGTASLAGSDAANAIGTAVAAIVRNTAAQHEITVNGSVAVAAVADPRVSALSGGGAGAETAAGGAAISTNNLTGSLTAALDGGRVDAHAGSVRVTSTLTGEVESFAVGGAGAAGFAAGGSVSKNVLGHTSEARVSGALVNKFDEVTNPGSVVVSAADASSARSRAGGVTGAGGAAFGAAVGTNDLGGSVRAVVSGAAVRGSDVTVIAGRTVTLDAQTLGGAGAGTVAVAGSSSTNINSAATTAEVSDAVLGASGSVRVGAGEDSSITALAGAVSGAGEVAFGAAFATNTLQQSVSADLRGSIVAAGGAITVGSTVTGTHDVGAAGGSGAGSLALAGSEASATLKTQVNASVSGSGLAAGGTIAVAAVADHTHDLDAGVVTGGIGAVGGSAANVHQETLTKAVVENAALSAGGAIAVGADANFERTRANAVAGSVGGIDIQAATVGVTADNDVSAGLAGTTITEGGAVSVAARLREALEVNATGATLGAVVVGAVSASAAETGTVEAYVDPGTRVTGVNALNVTSTADVTGEADGTAANGGTAGAGTVNRASVVLGPKVRAFVGGEVGTSGKVTVLADSSADASAELFSLSVGSLAAGRSDATAAITSDVEAAVGAGAVVAGGDVQITARHNFGPDGPTGGSARATAEAPTASLVGNFTGADPNATAGATTRATIDAGADVIGLNVTVQAQTSNVADADALALSLGAVAVGTSDPDAEALGGSAALVAGRVLTQGLTVRSETDARADAAGDGVSGGLGVGASGVDATATVAPVVTAEVDATVLAVNASISAESTGDARASAWGADANLVTVGAMKAEAVVRPTVSASVGGAGDVELKGGSLTVEARHNVGTALGARAEADAPVKLGLGTFAGAGAVAESLADVSASLDAGGRVSADGDVTFRAESVNIADADAAALNLGFVVVGSNNADATVSGRTTARIQGTVGDELEFPTDDVTVEAVGVNEATATADAPGGGLILGVNGASAEAVVAPTLAAGVTATGSIAAFGTIRIGTESETEARAETTAFTIGTVIAVGRTPAGATVAPTLDAFVRGGRVQSLRGDVVVEALHNYSGAEPLSGRGAFADSAASGGGFVSVNSSAARATSAAVVDAFTEGGSTISAGLSASFRARSKDHADASATGVTGAGIGLAKSFADANSNGIVSARVEEAVVNAGNLEVLALGLAVTDAFGGATAGTLAGEGGTGAEADSAPVVRAFVRGRKVENGTADAPIIVGGDLTINAFALGGAAADADGIGKGGFVVGASYATARWLPEVSAFIEVPEGEDSGRSGGEDNDNGVGDPTALVSWDIEAGGSIRVQAHSNYTESGAKDLGRRARATAEASSDGAASVAGAQALAEASSVVHAWVGAGSTLFAGDSVVIRALSRDRAESEADGDAGGFLAGGTILSQTDLGTDTRAYTKDATDRDVTRIEAFDKLRIRSESDLVGDSHATGGKGGFLGSGNASALTVAHDPLTLARVGDFFLIGAEAAEAEEPADAEMSVTAESRAKLTADSDQVIAGAIAGNFTVAKAQLLGADTQAQVGKGVDVYVDSFELLAVARNVFVEADSSAQTKFDLFKGTIASAVVDAEVNVLTEVGGTENAPTSIHATGAKGLTFRAGADTVSTYALASVDDGGILGKKQAIADNDRRVNIDLIISEDADRQNDAAGAPDIYDAYLPVGDYVRQALRNGKDDGTKLGANVFDADITM